MASTYSNLGIELIGAGEQTGTWGTTTNTNLGTLIDQAIGGYEIYSCTGGTDTITIPNGATGVARNMFLQLNGTGGGSLVVPTNTKLYFIFNNTSSAITVKVTTGVSVPAGAKMVLVCNGTDVLTAQNYLASLTLGTPLTVANGGSGVATAAAYSVLCGGTTSTGPIQAIASVGTTGQVLTSNGAGALPTMQTPTSFAGTVTATSGSTVSDGTTAFAIGYLAIPQNAQSGNYTLVLIDGGKHIYSTNSGAQSITIPTNASVAFPIGTALTIVNNGTTAITIVTTSLTVYQAGTTNTGNRTLATKGIATCLKVATDTWFISGAGIT